MKKNEILKERLILLHYCSGGDSRFVQKCLEFDAALSIWFEAPMNELIRYFPGKVKFTQEVIRRIRSYSIEEIKETLHRKKCHAVTKLDDQYPVALLQLHTPPQVLYYRGRLDILTYKKTLSVVGPRIPSAYMKPELQRLLVPLIKNDFVIISGMAAGTDAFAHETAIKYGGNTAAVLAFGVEQLYPKVNKTLKEKLEKQHLVITEYPPHIKPQKWQFPERNRLISGLGRAVFVVEAKKRSGSLITAETALEQGKDVFAMPGRISDDSSAGTNQLIQDGAKLILTAEDIIEEYSEWH